MSRKYLYFLPLFCLSLCFLFSGNTFATRYDGSTVFNPENTTGSYPSVQFHSHLRRCDGHYEDTWSMGFNNENFGKEISSGFWPAVSVPGCGTYEVNNVAFYGDFAPDSPIGTKLNLSNLDNYDYYSLVIRGFQQLVTSDNITNNGTGLNSFTVYTTQDSTFRDGTFVIIPTNLTTFENDSDYDNGTVKKYKGALYTVPTWSLVSGNLFSADIDLTDFYTNSPLGSSEQGWADYFIAYVPGHNLYDNPLEGSWGTEISEWCAVNQENNPDCVNQVMTKPGYDASDLEGQSFSVQNPFDILFGGFTSDECVSVPTLASWVHSPTSTVCKWFNADVRQAGTTLFSFSACMILFGFIMHWLSRSGDTVL